MKSAEELLREFAGNPAGLAAYAAGLTKSLAAQEQALATQGRILTEQEHALAEQERILTEQERTLSEQEQILAEKEQTLAEKAQQLEALKQETAQQEQLLSEAREYIAELKRQLFGPKSDKLNPEQEEQLRQLSGDLQEQAQRPPPVSGEVLEPEHPAKDKEKEKRKRRRRNFTPVQLEVQKTVLEPEDKFCGTCHREGRKIGQEVTTEYDYIPAKLICRETIRPKYTPDCPCGKPGITIAPLPPRLLPQSKLGLGLAVHLLLSRYDDHISYYTLERNFLERHGAVIPRQQMVQWVEKIAFLLLAIYNGIWEELLATAYLQIDETPVKVLDPEVKGRAATGYLWFYAHPKGDVFLEFCPSRGRAGPEERLRYFKGTIQTDAYAVYESLRREHRALLKRLACLGHARRYFYKAAVESCAEAIWFIAQIRQLYLIENETYDLSYDQRKAVRRQKAPALWRAMKKRALELKANPRFLPQSSLGKAVNYFLKEYTALVGYLRDGRFEIDNNLVENDVRPAAVGRRRWLFIGHPDAGWRSAVIYTIIQSCRRRGINPQDYLTDVLSRLPARTNHQVKDLLPSQWKPQPK